MKTIGVITDGTLNSTVHQSINEDLISVLGNQVIINNYFITRLKDKDIIDDDAILVLDNERLPILQPFIKNTEKIIIVERTFKKQNITPVFEIPKESKVLVVNSTWQTTLETVEHLYQITNSYLNFIPYKYGEQYSDIKIAITPGEAMYVPNFIERIVDIKNRCISTFSFLKILNKLNIDDKRIFEKLMVYSEETVDINSSINKQYKELFVKNALLENITEKLNEGILITNKNYDVLYVNKKAMELLKLHKNIKNINDIFYDNNFNICSSDKVDNKLIEYNGRKILVSKTKINYYENQEDYLFNFKEDFYIKNLGNSLNNELKVRGLIAKYSFDDIIHKSEKMDSIINFAKKIAVSDYPVLITGNTGTGKELFAQAIHNYSDRKYGPFVAINCAALPENLLESELFGYEKGAFTGANKEGKIGLFEQANTGTMFLDEIGDMPFSLQSRLLRVLQEKQIMRLGSDKLINIDVRIVAATNQNIDYLIKENRFRQDLFYRLNTFQLQIPPLKDRKEDILFILGKYTDDKSEKLDERYKKMLVEYRWDGNVRELINVSNYINIINNDIPDYIKDDTKTTENNFDIKSLSIYESYALLDILDSYKNNGDSIGRDKLLYEMKKNNMKIGEHRLKRALSELKELDLVEVNIGRNGTVITPFGIRYKENLKLMCAK